MKKKTMVKVKADVYYNQGKLFYDSGKFEQVIEEFNKAIDLNPKNAIAY
jgi:tetratricopeptide (TPR) repeat protein